MITIPYLSRITIALLVFSIGKNAYGQNVVTQLTSEAKLKDFRYLFDEMKKAYPYFGINNRVYGVDWLSNKEKYEEQILNTVDDKAYFKTLNDILNDLNNGHTDAYPTIIYPYFYNAYEYGTTIDTSYSVYLEELDKTDSLRSNYWAQINHELFFSNRSENGFDSTHTTLIEPNVEFKSWDSLSIVWLRIKSFSYDLVEEEAPELKEILNSIGNFENLIIDIQGNDGGSTEYWMQNIVPYLIKGSITYPLIYGFKNCERLKRFKPSYFKDTIAYKDIKLPKMPTELKNGSYSFRIDSVTIASKVNNDYNGRVLLLVDEGVFSSAEAFAYFCKASGFAKVVGERTSGDGVGTDPLLLTLPNSGIVIRFTGEMGLNPDGSANDEAKTIPDLIINAASRQERLENLINQIKNER